MIDDESLNNIEKLHRLKEEGVITQEDFDQAKATVLHGPKRTGRTIELPSFKSRPEEIARPADDDWMGWMKLPLRKYADFGGRSSRKEYWMFALMYFSTIMISLVIAAIAMPVGVLLLICALFGLFIPHLAVQVRRFHDQSMSGWFALLNLIPYVGAMAVFVFMLLRGTHGENRFGPDPLSAD